MKFNPFLLSLLIFVLFQSCTDEKNLRPYYFPYEKLMNEGLVYEYEAVGSVEEPPYYWYVRSLKDENGAFFTVMDYDYTFQPSQLVTEEIVNGGVILNSSILYSLDSLTNKQISKPVTITRIRD